MPKKNLIIVLGIIFVVFALLFTSVGASGDVSAAAVKWPILALSTPGGTISPSGIVLVNQGASKKFTIKPASGFRIVDVLVDGTSQKQITSYTFTNVTQKHVIHAMFASNLAIDAGAGQGGSIDPSGIVVVEFGKNKTFTITPSAGYFVANVIVDGKALGPMTSFTFKSVKTAHSIIAVFNNVFPVLATTSGGGDISPEGVIMVPKGANPVFSLTPDDGYHLVNVRVDGTWKGQIATFNLSFITGDTAGASGPHDIMAVFAQQQYPIFSQAGKGGTISPSGTTLWNAGSTPTYNFTANTGFHILDVQVDTVSKGAVPGYIFAPLTGPHIIVVTFAKGPAPTPTTTVAAKEEP
jgi:hypothetical protein